MERASGQHPGDIAPNVRRFCVQPVLQSGYCASLTVAREFSSKGKHDFSPGFRLQLQGQLG